MLLPYIVNEERPGQAQCILVARWSRLLIHPNSVSRNTSVAVVSTVQSVARFPEDEKTDPWWYYTLSLANMSQKLINRANTMHDSLLQDILYQSY